MTIMKNTQKWNDSALKTDENIEIQFPTYYNELLKNIVCT